MVPLGYLLAQEPWVTNQIVYTVDHGEEFGGKSWLKLTELRKLLSGFGCKLVQNHLRHPEENAHLERSHRTDDDEFYIPRILKIHNRQEFFEEAFQYLYYYNAVRKHSGISHMTPVQHLFEQDHDLDDKIKFIPPLILDQISVDLGDWSGYHLLAQNQSRLKLLLFLLSRLKLNPWLLLITTPGGTMARRSMANPS